MHKYLLVMALIATIFLGNHSIEAKEFKAVAYTVNAGDTLDIIVQKYLPANMASSDQAFADFKEGIIKYNYEMVFSHRSPNEIHEGDCLLIALWE